MISITGSHLLLAAGLSIAVLIWRGVYNYFFHPLAGVPGPLSGIFFPFWTMWTLYRRKLNSDLAELHKKYGPVVRVGPNQLSFATIEAQKVIYTAQPAHTGKGEYFSKEGTLQEMFVGMAFSAPNIGTIKTRALHKRFRRRVQPAFTLKSVLEQEPLLQVHLGHMFDKLDKHMVDGTEFNLTDYLSKLLWDLVGDLSFGEPLIREKHDTFEWLIKIYESWFPLLEAVNYALPQIEGLVKFGFSLVPPVTARAVLPTAKLRDCISRQDGRSDFLTNIMGDKDRDKTELHLTYDELHSNSTMLVVAGYKTNETSISALVYRLLSEPHQFRKLQQEIHANFNSLDEITGEHLLRLPFLNGCVQESLRLLPPLAGKFMSRRSPGATVEGIYVPFGTQVYAEAYTMQRSPKYWHAPEEFRPERWYERGEGSPFAGDVHEAYKPFSSGPRTCLGREMALQTLRLTVAKLAFRYDIDMANKNTFLWERDTGSAALYSKYKIMVRVSEHKETTGGVTQPEQPEALTGAA